MTKRRTREPLVLIVVNPPSARALGITLARFMWEEMKLARNQEVRQPQETTASTQPAGPAVASRP
jgi:hypothetical protein